MVAPLVHIIVLTYNTRDLTIQCFESLARLSYPNIQRVLVDNGSSDDCAKVVANRWPSAKVIVVDVNRGFTGGCNVGIDYSLKAGADYIILMPCDTVHDPQFVDEMVAVAERNPFYGLIGPRVYSGPPPSEVLWCEGGRYSLWAGYADGIRRGEIQPRKAMVEPREVAWVSGCGVMARARMVREIGPLIEALFAYSEDVEWSLRAARAGYKVVTAPQAVIWHLEAPAEPNLRRYRLATRNMLLVHHLYARWYHYLTAVPYMLVRWLGYMTLREVTHWRWPTAIALWRGALDAIWGRMGNPSS